MSVFPVAPCPLTLRSSPLCSDPVFFASLCGKESSSNPGPTVLAHAEAGDERLSSLRSAVRFSKANNFLGVIVDGDILVNAHLDASLPLPLADHIPSHFPVSLSQSTRTSVEKPTTRNGTIWAWLSGWIALFVYGGDFVYFR